MKSPRSLKIGTRGSALALAQSDEIISRIKTKHPEIAIQPVIIKTSGDIYKGKRLADVGGKGLFVKEIEEALLKNEIDFAVHSLKDLPGFLPEGLTLACFPKREDPRDCFLSLKFKNFDQLPKGALIGTGSPRRTAQILSLRPDLKVEPIRGNVDTRLQKLKEGNCDALILAAAGLHRLQREDRIAQYFDSDRLIPAVGQGILGIEVRKGDQDLIPWLKEILDDPETAIAAKAERAFLAKIGGDCYTPMAGYAWIENEKLKMIGWLSLPDRTKAVRREKEGSPEFPENLGKSLAEEILNAIVAHKTR